MTTGPAKAGSRVDWVQGQSDSDFRLKTAVSETPRAFLGSRRQTAIARGPACYQLSGRVSKDVSAEIRVSSI